jgi:hypothetical protein
MSNQEQGFLLLIDGLDWAFWTREDLQSGAAAVTGISRTNNHFGLDIPKTSTRVDVKTGAIQSASVSFKLRDISATLAALFAATTTDANPPSVGYHTPGETSYDPALFGLQVGIESIGPAGERGQFPAVQTYQLGAFHPGNNFLETDNAGAVYASAQPFIFAGRRVTLHRFTRSSAGAWQDYAQSQRVWWGTLRDGGSVTARTWSLTADGPDSWLKKILNQAAFEEPKAAEPGIPLSIEETQYGFDGKLIQYEYDPSTAPNVLQPWFLNWQKPDASTQDAALIGKTADELRVWFRDTLLAAALDVAGTLSAGLISAGVIAYAWSSVNVGGNLPGGVPGGDLNRYQPDAGSLKLTLKKDGVSWTSSAFGQIRIVLHQKIWNALGFSPEEQAGIDQDNDSGITFRALGPGVAAPYGPGGIVGTTITPDTFDNHPAGFWQGTFTSIPRPFTPGDALNFPDAAFDASPVGGAANSTKTRVHAPLYGGALGVGVLARDVSQLGGQIVAISGADSVAEPAFCERQLDAPPAAAPGGDNAQPYPVLGGVTSQRLFAFIGAYRNINTDKAERRLQLGRVSWRRPSDPFDRLKIQSDLTELSAPLALTRWHVPQAFNFKDELMAEDWLVLIDGGPDALAVVPVANLGTNDEGPSRADRAILSLLVSSGTSRGWFTDAGYTVPGYGSAAYLDRGDNNKSSALSLGDTATDTKSADFGLGIPAEMVAEPSEWQALAYDLAPELAQVTIAQVGPVSADAVLMGIMRPLGWAWSLRGGKYGAFKPSDNDATSTEDATLSAETIVGSLGGGTSTPSQSLRYRTALDAVELKMRRDPWTGKHWQEETLRSTDAGRFYRSGDSVLTVDAPYLTSDATLQAVKNHWSPIFKWLARRHFMVTGLKVLQSVGVNLWPGSRVRITHPWLVSQLGEYGVTSARGIVTAVSQDWQSATTAIDLLVTQPPGQGERIAAPEASAWAYDAGAPAIFCDTDFRRIGAGHNDLAAFEQPAWAGGTGSPDVNIFQYARGQLVQTLSATVSGVDLEGGRLDLSGPVTGGTWLRDCDSLIVLKGYATQGATWPADTFAPIANEDGEVDGSTANAVKWSDI